MPLGCPLFNLLDSPACPFLILKMIQRVSNCAVPRQLSLRRSTFVPYPRGKGGKMCSNRPCCSYRARISEKEAAEKVSEALPTAAWYP